MLEPRGGAPCGMQVGEQQVCREACAVTDRRGLEGTDAAWSRPGPDAACSRLCVAIEGSGAELADSTVKSTSNWT